MVITTFAFGLSTNDASITIIVFMAVVVPIVTGVFMLALIVKHLVVYLRAKREVNPVMVKRSRNTILAILGIVIAFFVIDIMMGLAY